MEGFFLTVKVDTWLSTPKGGKIRHYLFPREMLLGRSCLILSYSSEGSPALAVFRQQNCLTLTKPGIPYNLLPLSCVTLAFIKKHRSNIGLEIRPQSAFTAYRAPLPSANYSAE
jgi:hypothetical protein